MTLLIEKPAEPSRQDPEALFKEARQRRRRRRLIAGAVVVTLLAGTITTALLTSNSRPKAHPSLTQRQQTRTPPIAGAQAVPQVAWVDYSGFLHIGELNTLTQRVVTWARADPTASLVSLNGKVFWVQIRQQNGERAVHPLVFGFDLSTGHTNKVAAGSQVFASLDRSFLYVESSNKELAEYWPSGTLKRSGLHLPKGWILSDPDLLGNPTPVVADGILVRSASNQAATTSSLLAIWNPSTGAVHTLGDIWQMVGTYTAPGGTSSLVAWVPADCVVTTNCSLRVVNTADFSFQLFSSPLGYGFDWGGGFSPDGGQLAVFVQSNSGVTSPESQLALVNVASGSLRLVSGANISVGDSLVWAQWLPDGTHLIVGGTGSANGLSVGDNHFIVDSRSGQATSFRFIADGNQDVNYSAVVVS